MSDKYKKLYEAQKKEHEKTWELYRKEQKRAHQEADNYDGAMEDNTRLVAVMRKHLKAMTEFLNLNYPTKRPGGD